jgi:hypothetical protein
MNVNPGFAPVHHRCDFGVVMNCMGDWEHEYTESPGEDALTLEDWMERLDRDLERLSMSTAIRTTGGQRGLHGWAGASRRPVTAGSNTLTVELARRACRALKRVRRVKLRLVSVVTDGTGNSRELSRRLRLKR